MDVVCTTMYMYLHLKDGVLTFSSGIMHEFKVLLKFLCHDKDDDMLTSVTLLQNFTQWSGIYSEGLFLNVPRFMFFAFPKKRKNIRSHTYEIVRFKFWVPIAQILNLYCMKIDDAHKLQKGLTVEVAIN